MEAGTAAYVPLMHDYPDAPAQLPRDEVLARLKPWLEDGSRKKLGQHVKYDRHVLANHGIEVQGYEHDTMLQSYVLEVHRPHGLGSLAERHLGRSGIHYEDLCGKGAKQIPFSQVSIKLAASIRAKTPTRPWMCTACCGPRRRPTTSCAASTNWRWPAARRSTASSATACWWTRPSSRSKAMSLGQRILQLETEAYEIAGQPFNLGSPKQLGEIFFDKLGMPVVKKTATGARSTDEEVLEKLAEDYPLPAKLLEHRSLSSSRAPIPTSWRNWPIPPPAACTRTTPRPWR